MRKSTLVLCALMAWGCGSGAASKQGQSRSAVGGAAGQEQPSEGSQAGQEPTPAAGQAASDFGNSTAEVAAGEPAVLNPGAGDCQPGHYTGRMGGMYRTAVWGNGTVPVAFGTAEVAGQPGLEFWLERVDAECTAEEFCADFVIRGGKLRGWADPSGDPNQPSTMMAAFGVRFEMELSGELDCSTGQFRGQLENGCYEV